MPVQHRSSGGPECELTPLAKRITVIVQPTAMRQTAGPVALEAWIISEFPKVISCYLNNICGTEAGFALAELIVPLSREP